MHKVSTEMSSKGQLHQALNLKDLVFLNVACIVGLTTSAQVAQLGFSSIPLLALCIITFLIPYGLVVSELNARMPEEGGFYLWTRNAFGDFHGYVAAWSYWLCNIVWLATALLFVSIPALYLLGDSYLHLTGDPIYNGTFGIVLVWLVTLLNIVGMERAKWIQNLGGISTWICITLLLIAGIFFIKEHGSPNTFTMSKLIPDITNLELLPYFALVPFCFGGLELVPVMAGEVKNPVRNIPRAILLASIMAGLFYIIGTLMLIVIIPEGEIGIIEGAAQAFHLANVQLNIPGLAVIGALLVVFSTLGNFGGWLTGNARVPFVIGLDHYLPPIVAKVHPKYGTPHISLIMQSIVITILFILSNAGTSIEEAFLTLLEMSVILYFIPFLYMFAAFFKVTRISNPGSGLFPAFRKNKLLVWLITFLGFSTTLVATLFSCLPTDKVENKPMFVIKVVGGAIVLLGLGLTVFLKKKWSEKRKIE